MAQRTLLEADDPKIYDEEVRSAIGSTVVGRVVTTTATPATLLTIPLQSGRTSRLEAMILARRTGGSAGTAEDGAGYHLMATYKVVANVATLIGTVATLFSAESQAGWDATFTVSGQNILVQVIGALDNNVTWVGKTFVESVST